MGCKEGNGSMVFTNGGSYEGEWKANRMHGKGRYVKGGLKASPEEYNGDWYLSFY